jgi:protease-4
MSVLRPIGRFLAKAWWLLDASRRALLNLLLLGLVVALIVAWVRRGPEPLQDKTVLVLDLQGRLVEQFSGSARQQAMAQLRGQGTEAQTRLRDVLQALEAATKDEQIGAVLLDLDQFSGGGQAALREVAAALARFRQASGKPIYAYAAGYDQRGYLLAAQAQQVLMHPMGMVLIEGFGRYRNYYKDALDRLGIEANVIRVGTYKNFGEPYFANAPSPATLEAEAYLYGDLWGRYTDAVEGARKLDKGALARGIEALPQRLAAVGGDTAKLALQEKLVDQLMTRDELRELLIARGAKDEQAKSFRQVSLGAYLGHQKPRAEGAAVGVVVAEGEIVDGEAGPGKVGGDSTAKLIRQARENEQIKALVLRVNSPGGSAYASELVRRELELTRKAGKPVVVSMGDVAASGGYWISMAADRVIADASTVTGSIGVFGMLPTGDKLLEKLSIHTGGYTTSWLAGGGYDPRRPLDPRMRAAVQSGVQHIYDDFTAKAAAARKKPQAEIDAVAQGRVWTGAQALQRGLVDQLGSYGDALQAAARLAKLDAAVPPRLIHVERERGRLDRLLDSLGGVLAAPLLEQLRLQLGLPPLLAQAGQELASLASLSEGRKPFAAIVHCLCEAP